MVSLASRLRQGPLVGTFLKLPRREVVDVLALAGFDFIICDLEHAAICEQEAREVILAGLARGLPVIVRTPNAEPGLVNRVLEYGAAGVQVPHVRSREDAEAFVSASRYPPAGTRSASLAQPAANYGHGEVATYLSAANDDVLTVGQLETCVFDDPVEDVLAPLDVAFIGTFDLTIDAGVPGAAEDQKVREVVSTIERAADRTDTLLGVYASDASAAQRALASGYRYVAVGSDVGLLNGAASQLGRLRDPADG